MPDHDDRLVARPPTKWQKKVLINSLRLSGRQRTRLQKHVIELTKAWRKKTGWKPPKPKPKPKPPADTRRKDIVDWMWWLYNSYGNGGLGYSQSRPKTWIRNNYAKYSKPYYGDCSSIAIRAYQVAGAPSPSIYGYSGYGSTWDMEGHGRWVSTSDLMPGDLVFYNGHVGVYVGSGMMIDHGSSSGPRHRSIYYRSDLSSCRRYF